MITSMTKITCLVSDGIFMTLSAPAALVMRQDPTTSNRIIGSRVFGIPLAG